MLTINEVKQRLTDANLRRVAVKAGVHPATVYRFMQPDSQYELRNGQIIE
jgi:hypothetical protein